MSKKSNSVRNSTSAYFLWTRDSSFTPPNSIGGDVSRKAFTPASSQVSDLKPLLKELLDTLLVATKASAGIIRIRSLHGNTLQLLCSIGLYSETTNIESLFDLPCAGCEKTAIGHGLYSAEISACESGTDCRYSGYPFQSIVCAQLENDKPPKNPIGTITLFFNDQNRQDDQTSATVLSFARLIGIIVERNKSNRDTRRADLMAERQAIANEIHDSLAQTLVYARMRTSSLLESIRNGNEVMSARYANDIDEALETSQKNTRELIKDFRCAMDPSGLPNALQTLTEQFCHRNKIALEYINRVAHLELPLEYEIQVFHIVQEALANIAAHSEATHARLIVDFSDNYYVFTIEDNGSGGCAFTPVEGHYGMMIMRERAQRIGGEIKVNSSEGIGTHVQLYFPEPGLDWRAVNE